MSRRYGETLCAFCRTFIVTKLHSFCFWGGEGKVDGRAHSGDMISFSERKNDFSMPR
jgi:hypothetical protein